MVASGEIRLKTRHSTGSRYEIWDPDTKFGKYEFRYFSVMSVPEKVIVKSLRQKVNMKKSYFGVLNTKFDQQNIIRQNENWYHLFGVYISQYPSFASIRTILIFGKNM